MKLHVSYSPVRVTHQQKQRTDHVYQGQAVSSWAAPAACSCDRRAAGAEAVSRFSECHSDQRGGAQHQQIQLWACSSNKTHVTYRTCHIARLEHPVSQHSVPQHICYLFVSGEAAQGTILCPLKSYNLLVHEEHPTLLQDVLRQVVLLSIYRTSRRKWSRGSKVMQSLCGCAILYIYYGIHCRTAAKHCLPCTSGVYAPK